MARLRPPVRRAATVLLVLVGAGCTELDVCPPWDGTTYNADWTAWCVTAGAGHPPPEPGHPPLEPGFPGELQMFGAAPRLVWAHAMNHPEGDTRGEGVAEWRDSGFVHLTLSDSVRGSSVLSRHLGFDGGSRAQLQIDIPCAPGALCGSRVNARTGFDSSQREWVVGSFTGPANLAWGAEGVAAPGSSRGFLQVAQTKGNLANATGSVEIHDAVALSSGGVAIVGNYTGRQPFGTTTLDSVDVAPRQFVARFSSGTNAVWAVDLGLGEGVRQSVGEDPSGVVFACSSALAAHGRTPHCHLLSPAGQVAGAIGDPGPVGAVEAVLGLDASSSTFIAGWFRGVLNLDGVPHSSTAGTAHFLAELGATKRVRTGRGRITALGGGPSEVLVLGEASGDIELLGQRVALAPRRSSIFVGAFDPSTFTLKWLRTFTARGAGTFTARSGVILPNGQVVVTGTLGGVTVDFGNGPVAGGVLSSAYLLAFSP